MLLSCRCHIIHHIMYICSYLAGISVGRVCLYWLHVHTGCMLLSCRYQRGEGMSYWLHVHTGCVLLSCRYQRGEGMSYWLHVHTCCMLLSCRYQRGEGMSYWLHVHTGCMLLSCRYQRGEGMSLLATCTHRLYVPLVQVSAWGGYVFIINLVPLHIFALLLMGRFSHRYWFIPINAHIT